MREVIDSRRTAALTAIDAAAQYEPQHSQSAAIVQPAASARMRGMPVSPPAGVVGAQ